jgi:hypothetical protein
MSQITIRLERESLTPLYSQLRDVRVKMKRGRGGRIKDQESLLLISRFHYCFAFLAPIWVPYFK